MREVFPASLHLVRDVLAPAPILGVPPVAPYRACGRVCVAADLQERALYSMVLGNVNSLVRVISQTFVPYVISRATH